MVEIIVTENGNVRGVFTRVISASLTDSLNGECTFQFSVISSAAKEIFTGLEVQLKSDTLNYLFNVVKVSKSLSNVLNNSPCGSFQTAFIYTPYEEEQE